MLGHGWWSPLIHDRPKLGARIGVQHDQQALHPNGRPKHVHVDPWKLNRTTFVHQICVLVTSIVLTNIEAMYARGPQYT